MIFGMMQMQMSSVDSWGSLTKVSESLHSFLQTILSGCSYALDLNVKGSSAVGRAYFGQGEGPVFLNDIECFGTETSLLQCPFGSFVTEHDCTHIEDAGVICLRKFLETHTSQERQTLEQNIQI